MVTVFVRAAPFFGVTVTETLQVPTFRPLSVLPDTLQNFAKPEATLRENFEVESTLSFAYAAMDFAKADSDFVSLGIALVFVEPVVAAGTFVVGVMVDHSVVLRTGEE